MNGIPLLQGLAAAVLAAATAVSALGCASPVAWAGGGAASLTGASQPPSLGGWAAGLTGPQLRRRPPSEVSPVLYGDPALLGALGPVLMASSGASPPITEVGVLPPPSAQLPARVDLRPEMPPIRDQRHRPLCEVVAVCAALDHLARRRPEMAATEHSPQFLWWNYQRLIVSQVAPGLVWGDLGTNGPHLALLLRKQSFERPGLVVPGEQGVVAEALAPFNPETRPAAPADDLHAISRSHLGGLTDRIAAGEAIPADGAQARFLVLDLLTVKQVLSEGHPIIVGLPVDEQAWQRVTRDRDMLYVGMPDPAAREGTHAVLLVGYQDDPAHPGGGWFWLRNSWGSQWGNGGYARISYEFVEAAGEDPYYLEPLDAPFRARYELSYPRP